MANVYAITSMKYVAGPADPMVTVTGTVNGVAVTCSVWLSAINQAATAVAFQSLVGPPMLAAYNAANPPAPTAVVPSVSSFTQ